jgi:hypothetical protein
MGGRIPQPIKLEVIRRWLREDSRDEIAKDLDIGAGTVSGIIHEYRHDDADFELLRGVAVELRDRGLQVKELTPLFRLKSLLEEKEVQLEIDPSDNLFSAYKKFESIIVTLEVLCFKHGAPMDRFFELIRELYLQLDSLGISLDRLPEYLEGQIKEIVRLQTEIQNEVERKGATMNLLRDYQANMPAFRSAIDEVEKVTKERNLCQSKLDYFREQYHQIVWKEKEEEYEWYTNPEEVNKAKKELSSQIGGDHYASRLSNPGLKRIVLDLYRRPGKYVEAIRKVIDNYDMVHKQSI